MLSQTMPLENVTRPVTSKPVAEDSSIPIILAGRLFFSCALCPEEEDVWSDSVSRNFIQSHSTEHVLSGEDYWG